MPNRVFGEIEGVPEDTLFPSRAALSEAGVHRPRQAGISGSGFEGADSIVLSGGYEDDEDYGDQIVYTGHGGRDPQSGRQIADQTLTVGNLGLAKSRDLGLPVRVIRGPDPQSTYAPASGYRYDGLYRVEDYWTEVGRAGLRVIRFRLAKLEGKASDVRRPDQGQLALAQPHLSSGGSGSTGPAQRVVCSVQRIVRDTAVGRRVKQLYSYQCQVCGTVLEGPAGQYAEAAHIRGLGAPHHGPDVEENVLCLCPNHHVLFDMGAFTVNEDYTLNDLAGRLVIHPQHALNADHLSYHRVHYGDLRHAGNAKHRSDAAAER